MTAFIVIALVLIILVLLYLLFRKPIVKEIIKETKYEKPAEHKQLQPIKKEIEPFDFSDGIQLPGLKMEFANEPKGIEISSEYIQALDIKAIAPIVLAASGQKFAIITSEVSGASFMKYANGFSGTPMFDKAGKLVGHGSFELISRTAVLATAAYGLASYVFACAHLQAINSKLTDIKNEVDRVKDMLLNEHLALLKTSIELQNDPDFWQSPNLIENHFYDMLKDVNWWLLHSKKEFSKLLSSKKKEEKVCDDVLGNVKAAFLANNLLSNITKHYFGNNKSKTNDVRELISDYRGFIDDNKNEISKLTFSENALNLLATVKLRKKIEPSELPDEILGECDELLSGLEEIEIQNTFYYELPADIVGSNQ